VEVSPIVEVTPVSPREKLCELLPNAAVISAVVYAPPAEVLTIKAALDKPTAMSTDAGTVADGTLLDRLMVVLFKAELLKVTVQVDDAGGVTLAGMQFRAESTGVTKPWLMATVALLPVTLRASAFASAAARLTKEN
jgi:hypothetical protein